MQSRGMNWINDAACVTASAILDLACPFAGRFDSVI